MTQSIDVSGLPPAVVEDIQRLVATLRGNLPAWVQRPEPATNITAEEFDRLLDEFSAGLPALPSLPNDFSRVDIYGEHD
jgi:hypothetical protein